MSDVIYVKKTLLNGEKEDDRYFGNSVALSASGKIAVIANPNRSIQNSLEAGVVSIYEKIEDTWIFREVIKAPHPSLMAFFGRELSLSADGDIICIGAPGDCQNQGGVFIYTRQGNSWVFFQKMNGSNKHIHEYGRVVDLSADGLTLLVGYLYGEHAEFAICKAEIPGDFEPKRNLAYQTLKDTGLLPVSATGSLSGDGKSAIVSWADKKQLISALFRSTNADWQLVSLHTHYVTKTQQHLKVATSANMDGRRMAASVCPTGSARGGIVFVYRAFADEYNSGWSLINGVITPPNEASYNSFGKTIQLSETGNWLAVGCPYAMQNGVVCGNVTIFEREGYLWKKRTVVWSNAPQAYDAFGDSIGLSKNGGTLIVSAESSVDLVSCVYVFDAYEAIAD